MLFCVLGLLLNQTSETTMQFAKVDSVATNPLPPYEKLMYTKVCANKLVQNFKETPVYLVYTKEDKEEFVQIGVATCIYMSDNWLQATLKLKKDIPKDYVLRAKSVATDVEPNKVDLLIIKNATITEFYLKPKSKASVFQ